MAKRLKWGTIEYLNALIDEYFANEDIPNIAGLCLRLGITKDTWTYYVYEKWRTHRMEGEELEARQREAEQMIEDGILEEDMEITANKYLLEEFSQNDRRENDHIKAKVSDALKRAQLRIDEFTSKRIHTTKNPAGAIFYAKAALGYRETVPEASADHAKLPSPINIIVMPPPDKPQQLENVVEASFKVLPESK
jgi:hypothetical protein